MNQNCSKKKEKKKKQKERKKGRKRKGNRCNIPGDSRDTVIWQRLPQLYFKSYFDDGRTINSLYKI